jgi:hypothetical protein
MEELCFLALARTEEHLSNFSNSADLELGQLVYQGTTSRWNLLLSVGCSQGNCWNTLNFAGCSAHVAPPSCPATVGCLAAAPGDYAVDRLYEDIFLIELYLLEEGCITMKERKTLLTHTVCSLCVMHLMEPVGDFSKLVDLELELHAYQG